MDGKTGLKPRFFARRVKNAGSETMWNLWNNGVPRKLSGIGVRLLRPSLLSSPPLKCAADYLRMPYVRAHRDNVAVLIGCRIARNEFRTPSGWYGRLGISGDEGGTPIRLDVQELLKLAGGP